MTNSPRYYHYFGRTVKIEPTADGRSVNSILNTWTGEFEPASSEIAARAQTSMSHPEIWRLGFDEFVMETEGIRMHEVQGAGPAFALYEVVAGIIDLAKSESRAPTDEERGLIDSILYRTYLLWEEGAAKNDTSHDFGDSPNS